MWRGPGFRRMLLLSSLFTPIKHTPYLWGIGVQTQPQLHASFFFLSETLLITIIGLNHIIGMIKVVDNLLTSCEHGRKHRWSSSRHTPRRTCCHTNGCGRPRFQSSVHKSSATAPVTSVPPWKHITTKFTAWIMVTLDVRFQTKRAVFCFFLEKRIVYA